MCLYPKLIKNPKYKPNKKNGGVIPAIGDKRVIAVPIGCGRCAECLKKKAREWQIRLFEEVKNKPNGEFITLTFSNEAYKELAGEIPKEITGYDRDNAIATLGMRRFLERWRKKHKKSLRHWFITEIGHQGTENIHMHGFIWRDEQSDKGESITKHWQYGYVWEGYEGQKTYVTERTVNYVTKYLTKQDQKHRYYKPIILTSAGIGRGYENSVNAQLSKYKKDKTKEYYVTKTGHKVGLPVYYRNKIYTEEEREKLWIEKLNKEIRYVDGIKIDVSKDQERYIKIRESIRDKYIRLGYNGEIKWSEKEYENERRILLQKERIEANLPKEETNPFDMSKHTNWDNWK